MELKWEEGYCIRVRAENGEVVIGANREGLLSLANHLLALSNEKPGSHIHLDAFNALEDDSAGLIIEIIR